MKKWILLTAIPFLPLTMMAQDDDMYFVPTKENVAKESETYGMPRNTYYSGSHRSVDDYNRRAWSSVTPIDSAGNDIISFSPVRGVYPDSAYTQSADDYKYTRKMARFDGYSPDVAYWEGYRDGRWSSPWYHSSYYYTWYDPWYDPWYYGYYGYYGYYSPWRYGWYGSYYRPWGYYGWYAPRWGVGYRSYTHRHGGSVNRSMTSGLRYYDRRNYRSDGMRRTSNGSWTNARSGNMGSGPRPSNSFGNSGSFSSGSGMRSSGSMGSGMRSSGSMGSGMRSSGGGGRIGVGRR